jgi:hypothetical protein
MEGKAPRALLTSGHLRGSQQSARRAVRWDVAQMNADVPG